MGKHGFGRKRGGGRMGDGRIVDMAGGGGGVVNDLEAKRAASPQGSEWKMQSCWVYIAYQIKACVLYECLAAVCP